jgi:hypothetical protein
MSKKLKKVSEGTDDLFRFMMKRQEMILSGRMGLEPEERAVRTAWNMKRHRADMVNSTREAVRYDPSDPFLGPRLAYQWNNGIAEVGDVGRNRRP